MTERPEIEALERVAAWRLRLLDADPDDRVSAEAAAMLERLADDLRRHGYAPLWTELQAIGNWLAESDAISDYAEAAAAYRSRIGVTEKPPTGADYIRDLLRIARDLI